MALLNLGSLTNSPIVRSESVTSTDTRDIFQFTLGSTRNINIALTGVDGLEQVALSLFRDSNNNGVLDSSDLTVFRTFDQGSSDATINLRSQSSGRYFARVTYAAGSPVNYNIALSSTSPGSPSNLLPKEIEVGSLYNQSVAYDDLINNADTSDTYHFTLETNDVAFSLSLNQLIADADVRLIKDLDKDSVVDAGEVIASSQRGGTLSESIYANLNAGEYFVQVYQYSGATSYNLTMIGLS